MEGVLQLEDRKQQIRVKAKACFSEFENTGKKERDGKKSLQLSKTTDANCWKGYLNSSFVKVFF